MSSKARVVITCGTKFHSDYVAEQLYKYGLLEKAITSHPRSRYVNRTNIPAEKLKFLTPIFVLPYFLKKAGTVGRWLARSIEYRLPALFDYYASKNLRKANISITWSWSGLHTIRAIQKAQGIAIVEESGSCNLEQSKLLQEEYSMLGLEFPDPTPSFIINRELQEVKLADYILCPSNYVAETFIKNNLPREKCVIIPYGVNLTLFNHYQEEKPEFSILFVGTIGVRKGLIYLFKALELIHKTQPLKCLLIGTVEESFRPIFDIYKHLFTYVGRVEQKELSKYYNSASAFVFPSLDEGMALVQLEAMACGLPLICTTNSGGDSIVQEGSDGFVVPIRDHILLAEKISFLYKNPEVLKDMSAKAVLKAKKFTWDAYGDKLCSFINQLSADIGNGCV
ncbi:glycosyltransferase family 4 protein [Mucilaginibacter achroorhodeus]|uniref:Glycosyltransferase family 4 protein n=1 Tax=Mucilaginibacter achroorhodeus TaxID=2599294 RepID=A0A563U194_9SPHI|nr:glycosyltransferase family 4 protein [Mucilaginibacter achroorhodeus]TWR25386.1 glycosyltransferase family 4 protein [Mucilaginibacter achroorhodeus]